MLATTYHAIHKSKYRNMKPKYTEEEEENGKIKMIRAEIGEDQIKAELKK